MTHSFPTRRSSDLVRQEVIGVRHLREFFRGFRIVRIPVGMQFLGKIAIGLLDIGLARIPRYPQNRIWISHLLPYCLYQFTPAPFGDRSFMLQAPAPRRPLID